MIHNILRHLGGIEHYGIISLCLFCAVFLGILVWAFLQRKSDLDRIARAPLDAESEEPPKPLNPHE
jgi:cbb3-type cytochrome oxidase subunit 3